MSLRYAPKLSRLRDTSEASSTARARIARLLQRRLPGGVASRARVHGTAIGRAGPRWLGHRDDRAHDGGQETDSGDARADHRGGAAGVGGLITARKARWP